MAPTFLLVLITHVLFSPLPSAMAADSEMEPFLIEAQAKYAEGDYNGSRDLCEEILKRAPRAEKAQEVLKKSKSQLQILAKEAYFYGIEAERMTQLDMAKSYWNRASQYVRPNDPLHREIASKLEKYR